MAKKAPKNDPEVVRVAQVRSLFVAWEARQPETPAGMADMKALKFHAWLMERRPELLPRGGKGGDAEYQHLKTDLKGLVEP